AGVVTAISPVILQSGIHIGHSGWDGTGTPEIPAILFGLGAVQLARTPDGFAADMAAKRRAQRAARPARRPGAGRSPIPAPVGSGLVGVGPHRRARQGLLVAPEARGIFPGLSVLDNLRVVRSSDDEMAQVFHRFPILGERRAIPASNLSGGEQQMLTLAPLL